MYAVSLLVTIGAILQLIVTGNSPLLIVGRLVLGAGVGIASNAVTLYLSEIPPAEIRGSMVSSWQLFLALGQVLGAGVAQGTKDYSSTFSYRFPIALNIAICLTIVCGMFFVPESPRWLVSKGRDEEAERAFMKVHKGNEEYDLQSEMKVIHNAMAAEAHESGGDGSSKWGDIFKGPERRKFFGAFGILVCQQIGGVQFIFSYGTVFFKDVGMDDPFLVTMICDIVEVLGVIVSFALVNRYGRRPLLITTTSAMAAVLLVMGCLGTVKNRSPAMNTAIASMIIIYVFIFNLAWGGLAWVIATELSAGRNRTKIMGVATASFWVAAWAVTFTLPYLYNPSNEGGAGLGPMVGFIYFGGTIIGLLFVYFYIPETLGRSLEEITLLMELEVPTRAWKSYQTTLDNKPAEQWKAEEKGSRFAGRNKGAFVENAGEEKAVGGGALQRTDSD